MGLTPLLPRWAVPLGRRIAVLMVIVCLSSTLSSFSSGTAPRTPGEHGPVLVAPSRDLPVSGGVLSAAGVHTPLPPTDLRRSQGSPWVVLTVLTRPSSCGPIVVNGTSVENGASVVVALDAEMPVEAPACLSEQWERWTASSTVALGSSTAMATTLEMTGNGTLTASWSFDGAPYTVQVLVSPHEDGQVLLGGEHLWNGSLVELDPGNYSVSVLPQPWSAFEAWDLSGPVSISGGVLHLYGSATVTALFLPQPIVSFDVSPDSCTVSFAGVNYGNGSSQGFLGQGESYAISANPCSGVSFADWGAGGGVSVPLGLSSSTRASVWGNGSLWLNDSAGPFYPVGITVQPTAGGSVFIDGAGPLVNGSSLDLVAGRYAVSFDGNIVEGNGYAFEEALTQGALSYARGVLEVAGAGTLIADFGLVSFVNLTMFPSSCPGALINGRFLLNGFSRYLPRSPPLSMIQALPCPGYSFSNWSGGYGLAIGDPDSPTTTLWVNQGGNLNATYTSDPTAQVSIDVNPSWAGAVLLNGTSYWSGATASLPQTFYGLAVAPSYPNLLELQSVAVSGALWTQGPGHAPTIQVTGGGAIWVNFTELDILEVEVDPAACSEVEINGSSYGSGSSAYLLTGTYQLHLPGCSGSSSPVLRAFGDASILEGGIALQIWGNASIEVSFFALAASLVGPANLATGASGEFTVSVSGGWSPYNYTIFWGDGSQQSVVNASASAQEASHSWSAAGSDWITVVVHDSAGESAYAVLEVQIASPSSSGGPSSSSSTSILLSWVGVEVAVVIVLALIILVPILRARQGGRGGSRSAAAPSKGRSPRRTLPVKDDASEIEEPEPPRARRLLGRTRTAPTTTEEQPEGGTGSP